MMQVFFPFIENGSVRSVFYFVAKQLEASFSQRIEDPAMKDLIVLCRLLMVLGLVQEEGAQGVYVNNICFYLFDILPYFLANTVCFLLIPFFFFTMMWLRK